MSRLGRVKFNLINEFVFFTNCKDGVVVYGYVIDHIFVSFGYLNGVSLWCGPL